ncbi:MAG: F0F1 ATP synthase subunit delta, partial [Actinobacteria bacterium]|nr:F0F1 ATP synthase subunit delta [Actinomycetota bacterium]
MENDRVNGYAAALFEVARAEGVLPRVEEELFNLSHVLSGNDELRSTLTDPAIPSERRVAVIEDLLGRRATPITTLLVSFVIGAGRARELPAIISNLVERAAS